MLTSSYVVYISFAAFQSILSISLKVNIKFDLKWCDDERRTVLNRFYTQFISELKHLIIKECKHYHT